MDRQNKKIILVVDDLPDGRALLETVLKGAGYDVVSAANGLEALERLKNEPVDIIISDILMPKMDGFQFCRAVRSDNRFNELPFIFYTASYADQADEQFALSLGADKFVVKPVEPFGFLKVLKAVLEEETRRNLPPLTDNSEFISEHNTRLIQKLEHKLAELEKTNELLQRRDQELKEYSRELHLSMDKYRNLIDNAQEGIYQTSPDGRLLMANRAMANMLGYDTPEDLLGKLINITGVYVEKGDRDRLRDLLDKQGVARSFETRLYHRNGSIAWVSFNARGVRDDQGNILHYEGLAEDITLRKQTEETLGNTLSKLRKAMEGAIKLMVNVAEAKDPYTAGHQKRVANLARAIAQEIGLPDQIIDGIRLAASIHDIGKIAVPGEILSKSSKLSELEFNLIKTHSQAGYEILSGIEFPWPIADMVSQHHEKIDGSGYPQGLKDQDILIEAKIICVADVVEAMASHRPYRPTLGIERTLEEIKANREKLFDREVVNACLCLFQEKGFVLE